MTIWGFSLIKIYKMFARIKNILYCLPHILVLSGIVFMYFVKAEGVIDVMWTTNLWETSILQPRGGDIDTSLQHIALEIIKSAKIALNGVALLAMAYVGYLWISSMGDEEKQNDGKYRILLILVGLFLINIPELLYTIITGSSYLDDNFWRKVRTVSTRDAGGIFNESSLNTCNYFLCTQNFWGNGSTIAVMKFFEVTMIGAAVVMFTWGWFTMIFRGWDENSSKQGKMRLLYGVIALIFIGFIETIYRTIFFGGGLNWSKIMQSLLSVGNFFIFVGGPIAIIYIIIGAYYYITSWWDEESADKWKRIILYTFMATILLILAYTILIEIVWLNLG